MKGLTALRRKLRNHGSPSEITQQASKSEAAVAINGDEQEVTVTLIKKAVSPSESTQRASTSEAAVAINLS